ncbi:hypothetical protein [Rhizobium anhuiense]|uniref:Uncharacterized protein n=1 Tax=Rhizobium anhuiense TaxID=1184720 RepID=A0A3S0Q9U0_9HYPH|nr:hypothetical protein [Rhizobium anhuiense]RUM02035.1 hypothetical protein EEQ99_13300 [Rhizobium anhuiense]GGD80976.1 hypothetical protein GCM10008012_26000 [Rhizobium anhuiense]
MGTNAIQEEKIHCYERWVVFSVHGETCYIDGHPIDLLSMQVDHIIPEFLLSEPRRLADVLKLYGLPPTFDLNSYANWMPTCAAHNNLKRGRVFEATPLIQIHLQAAADKVERAQEFEKHMASKREIGAALNVLERAASTGDVDPNLVMPLIDAFQRVRRRAVIDKVEELKIPITMGFGGSDGGSAYARLYREIMNAPIRLTPTLVLRSAGLY